MNTDSLRNHLNYEPHDLRFGTSGRRGDVVDLTQLEIYINALAELEYLLSRSPEEGGIAKGQNFYYGYDLRPSSSQYSEAAAGRGEIAQAIEQAIRDAGLTPVNLGRIPTPALTYYALQQGCGSIMITGSHIPFDRNGYKTNSRRGELRKEEEEPINQSVARVRERVYDQPFAESLFDETGNFKTGHRELSPETHEAYEAYMARYQDFFAGRSLAGQRVLVYQHSAVGRDLLTELLKRLGAEVIPAGRSETFVPIDTENIDDAQLQIIQGLADAATNTHGPLDAVVSIDGDSDRPLVLGVEPSGKVRFFGGDLIGMIVAENLEADSVVVPISSNDAIDRGVLKDILEPKTKIGSPYVIAGMEKAKQKGKTAICGWEANGGFLTGSDFVKDGHTLKALPTRDAILPILTVLFAMSKKQLPMVDLFAQLPHRYSKAALLKKFPRPTSLKIVAFLSPSAERSPEVINQELAAVFTPELGFSSVSHLDYTDGVRIYFTNGDVAHIRPSGNADELRIYAVADTQERADEIARYGVEEPNGILRTLEKKV